MHNRGDHNRIREPLCRQIVGRLSLRRFSAHLRSSDNLVAGSCFAEIQPAIARVSNAYGDSQDCDFTDHVNSLNLIEVDFYKCEGVETSWKAYLSHLNSANTTTAPWPETKERLLAELLFQMGRVLKFDIPALDMFKGGYAPGGGEFKENRENEVLEYIHHLSEGNKAVPIWLKGITPQDAQPQIAPRAE
jgi:hypothetical protein